MSFGVAFTACPFDVCKSTSFCFWLCFALLQPLRKSFYKTYKCSAVICCRAGSVQCCFFRDLSLNSCLVLPEMMLM